MALFYSPNLAQEVMMRSGMANPFFSLPKPKFSAGQYLDETTFNDYFRCAETTKMTNQELAELFGERPDGLFPRFVVVLREPLLIKGVVGFFWAAFSEVPKAGLLSQVVLQDPTWYGIDKTPIDMKLLKTPARWVVFSQINHSTIHYLLSQWVLELEKDGTDAPFLASAVA